MHKEEARSINDADPPIVVGGGWVNEGPPNNPVDMRAYRKQLGDPTEILGPVLEDQHNLALATAIANSGFAVGFTWGMLPSIPECGEEQDYARAAWWDVESSAGSRLATLGDLLQTPVDSVTILSGVNNAEPNMIVGWGENP